MSENFCLIIDDIIDHNRLTIKILWALTMILSSSCLGAGIRGIIYEVSNVNMILLALGLIGTSGAFIVYVIKVIFPRKLQIVNSPLPYS